MTITRRYFLKKKVSSCGKAVLITVLWGVLNNAGIAVPGEVEWTPLEDLERVCEVNAAGTLRVTKAFLPLLRKSRGRLVNNTSACGEFICPGFVSYCMSKSAAIALSVGLRIEMKKWGVKVISIQPFFYKTPITNPTTAVEMADCIWSKSDPQTQKDYGERYKDNFLANTRQLLARSSTRVEDVLYCFEDALTAEEPLATYTPAYFPDKLSIKVLKYLPKVLEEHCLRHHLERGCKPAALRTGGGD